MSIQWCLQNHQSPLLVKSEERPAHQVSPTGDMGNSLKLKSRKTGMTQEPQDKQLQGDNTLFFW